MRVGRRLPLASLGSRTGEKRERTFSMIPTLVLTENPRSHYHSLVFTHEVLRKPELSCHPKPSVAGESKLTNLEILTTLQD